MIRAVDFFLKTALGIPDLFGYYRGDAAQHRQSVQLGLSRATHRNDAVTQYLSPRLKE
jgi:hypothetical protein